MNHINNIFLSTAHKRRKIIQKLCSDLLSHTLPLLYFQTVMFVAQEEEVDFLETCGSHRTVMPQSHDDLINDDAMLYIFSSRSTYRGELK